MLSNVVARSFVAKLLYKHPTTIDLIRALPAHFFITKRTKLF